MSSRPLALRACSTIPLFRTNRNGWLQEALYYRLAERSTRPPEEEEEEEEVGRRGGRTDTLILLCLSPSILPARDSLRPSRTPPASQPHARSVLFRPSDLSVAPARTDWHRPGGLACVASAPCRHSHVTNMLPELCFRSPADHSERAIIPPF
ncbi:hypothetical protein SRHO_G00105270 [Serrasalmus rhombeus]